MDRDHIVLRCVTFPEVREMIQECHENNQYLVITKDEDGNFDYRTVSDPGYLYGIAPLRIYCATKDDLLTFMFSILDPRFIQGVARREREWNALFLGDPSVKTLEIFNIALHD